MAVTERRPAPAGVAPPHEAVAAENKTPPIKIWAPLGAVIVVFFAYILISWVTGDFFQEVKNDASEPPTWMKIELVVWQVLSIPVALYLLWRFAVRPYMRERTIGTDGVLVIAFATLWVQDPWSSAGNHWFVYNTWMVNYGSWAQDVPWFSAYGEPGAMTSEPILFTPAAYVYIMLLAAVVGCWFMRKARERWPGISTAKLVGICFVGMCAFDVVVEGLIWLPLGVFEYPGGHWAIFPDTYHKYPLNEMVTIGAVFTAIACLRFFRDDRGLTWAERGVDKLRLSPGRTVALRALAVIAVLNVAMFLGYNVMNTGIGFNSTEWPDDLQKRSYFTNNLCGEGTDRACPGNHMPIIKENGIYPNSKGGITTPHGERPFLKIVPFDRGSPGGSD